jgi:hypothetical protein
VSGDLTGRGRCSDLVLENAFESWGCRPGPILA